MPKLKIGRLVFLVAILIALGLGIAEATGIVDLSAQAATATTVLVVSGLVIGFLNIQKKESTSFMVASLVLGAGAGLVAALPFLGEAVQIIAGRIAAIVLPAAFVVAIVTILRSARN